jgi:prepilin-type N-terminal cleavage/methylation domain-containing protein/prepilin-type processing-associated H-X9-DG protein
VHFALRTWARGIGLASCNGRQAADLASEEGLGVMVMKAKDYRGFTLIELLVVIAIIALLMSILMPAMSRVREQARQKSCATRIRQHVLALNMYGDENNTKLPLPSTGGGWLQDVAVNTVHFMLRTGLTRQMFYCPSNTNHQKYNDYFWLFNNQSWNGKRFTNENGFIVSGYCYLLQLAPPAQRPDIIRYQKDTEKKVWLKSTTQQHPASKEVVVDSIMGAPKANTKYGYDFRQVQGGIFTEHGVYDQTSHLKNDFEPAGGNIGFMDGHVEWRKFAPDVDGNGTAVARYTLGRAFFW